MKLHELRCPNCNATIHIDVKNDAEAIFCPYCGTRFLLDDENKSINVNKNVNINKNIKHTKETVNVAEIIKAKSKDSEKKRDWWMSLIIFAVVAVAFFLLWHNIFTMDEKEQDAGKIRAGIASEYEGLDYEIVIKQFEKLGFTNIEAMELEGIHMFHKKGTVKSVSVGGFSSFSGASYFYPDDPVVIIYY